MKVYVYCTLWNEEKILPYFIRHYSQFCDKLIFYDNGSSDMSVDIIKSYPNTEVREYDTSGTLNDSVHVKIKEQSILEAKKEGADFAIVVDCDEFIYHKNIKQFLSDKSSEFSIFYPIGYQMVSNDFPTTSGQIYDEVNTGSPDAWYCKPVLINLRLVDFIKYDDGLHEMFGFPYSRFSGKVYHPIPEELRPLGQYGNEKWGNITHLMKSIDLYLDHDLKLLHYKFIDRNHLKSRYLAYMSRLSESNRLKGLGNHYEKSINNNSIDLDFDNLIKKSIRII